MTRRLYYEDSYRTRFSAHVVEQVTWEGQPGVVLDRTAFYPASGGQPADHGTLCGMGVLDVVVRGGDGAVIHVLESPLPGGSPQGVEGEVDWSRRFDHMQQHSGQHVISAAFERLLDADTVGFHLGVEISTVDIDVARLGSAAVAQVEELANQVVWENRPVSARFVSTDELASLVLRRPPPSEGSVRIVEVDGFDINPCGGTHVAHTGEIGPIKILRLDYRGDETRVEFLCGARALRDYAAKNTLVNRLAGRLTVGHSELDEAIARLQNDAKQLRRDLRRARRQLLESEACQLAGEAELAGSYRVVRRVWENRDRGELRALAQGLTQRPNVVALLATVGGRTDMCFARADGMELDAAALVREACVRLKGKGGGQPHLAQGSAPVTDPMRVRAVLCDLLPGVWPEVVPWGTRD